MSERVQELFDSRIGKVVRAYERGMGLSDIAEQVGVSAPTIAKWLTEEGYKHKKKGRIPLAMKARVRDLHLRGWDDDKIARLLNLGLDRVREFADPKENPILGGEKDPLKVKGERGRKKKKKGTKRGQPSKKKTKEKDWPPPRHRCRKHWNADEKAYVLQLIQKGIPPGVIYKRMRASRKRQVRIWREAGGKGMPPNFPPSKGPFTPPEGPSSPSAAPAVSARAREAELEGEAKLAQLEAEAADRKARIAELEAQKKADEKRLKALSEEVRSQARAIESSEAIAKRRRQLPEAKPSRRRVEAGSYEDEVLGLPVGSLVDPGKPGRPKTKKPIKEFADNGRYFVVSKDWADLKDAKPDELKLFAAYLSSKRFPTRVERSGDQPRAYFESSWPKKIEERWIKAVDDGLELIDKYREKKRALRKNKMFSKRIAAYLAAVYDGYRNSRLNSSQKAEAREQAADHWARLNRLERLVMIYDMKYADKDGAPTRLGIDRSQAAKILVEKASRRASRKLGEKRIESKKRAIDQAAQDDVDDISSILAKAQERLALSEGDEE